MDALIMKQISMARLAAGIELEDIPHMLECIGAIERHYSKSEYVFMEGQDVKQIGFLLYGSIQMIKEDIWGNKAILETCVEGGIFGESFVCGDQSASTVSFICVSDCHILFLPFSRLLNTCHIGCKFHKRLIENMVVMIATKNVQMLRKMEILSKKNIREKILVWLSYQVQDSNSSKFTTPLGRLELADYLSVDRSALTRELNRMKQEGFIEFEKNTFELKVIP